MSQRLTGTDVLVLLKIAAHRIHRWELSELASELDASIVDIQPCIQRLVSSKLVNGDALISDIQSFKDFIVSDVNSLFPVVPGPIVHGTSTGAKSGPVFTEGLPRFSIYTWPNPDGIEKGYEITPISPLCPFAAINDSRLRDLLAITETMRIHGKHAARWAEKELDKMLFKI